MSCSGTPRSRQRSGSLSRVVICSWLARVLGDVRCDLPGVQLDAVLGAGQDAGVQLLAEADRGRLAVAGIAVEARAAGGVADGVA